MGTEKYLLLPLINNKNYDIIGYNWFDLNAMNWNSCSCFTSIIKALEAYSSYRIYNANINIDKIGGE